MKKILSAMLVAVISLSNLGFIGSTIFSASTEAESTKSSVPASKMIEVNELQVSVPEFIDDENLINEGEVNSINEEQTFDLTSNEAQTQIIELSNGEVGSLTIAPEISKDTRGKYTLSTGTSTWNVYWYGAIINFGYKIKVSNPSSGATTITSYYGEWYTTIGASVSGESFTRNSSKSQVIYKLNVNQTQFISYTYRLTSTVSGSTLTTKVTF